MQANWLHKSRLSWSRMPVPVLVLVTPMMPMMKKSAHTEWDLRMTLVVIKIRVMDI